MSEYRGSSGEVVRGDLDSVLRYAAIDREFQQKKQEWIQALRSDGIVAAHPDDGWVDRENNVVQLCYAHFIDDVRVGSRVAIGNRDKWRVVVVTDVIDTRFGVTALRFRPERPE